MQFLMFCVDNHVMNQKCITFKICIFDNLFFCLSSLENSARFFAILLQCQQSCLDGFFTNVFLVHFWLLTVPEGWEVVSSQTLLVALFHNSNIP